ncbi:hypothetical protein [Paraburkholderia sp. HD33-4]|uniref:hypothetical protein n=1 Tax=Paraburkholderia sp. HD33-4 TaxID=2883242 RepID=UPI001F298C09|nr:hypothetical protein [Paraburkholderia sp. HD33-4]
MKRVHDPFDTLLLPLTLKSGAPYLTRVTLQARDIDSLLEAAIAVKNVIPVERTPEITRARYNTRRDMWSVTVRTRRTA